MKHGAPAYRTGAGRGIALALLLCAFGLGACAVVEAPPGGPVDIVPPALVSFAPDSGAVNLGAIDHFQWTFSEKMNRVGAGGWLHFYPAQKIRKTSWHGATRADVLLENPLPADTVVVVEITANMKDAHKVSGFIERRFPIATGDSIPVGRVGGSLVMADSALTGGMIELYSVPDDSSSLDEQTLLRRTRCDANGHFDLEWLPVPSGPYLLKGFADGDKNARIGEKEGRRVFPDTVSLTREEPEIDLKTLEVFPVDTPGNLKLEPLGQLPETPGFVAFIQAIAANDTGWTPGPVPFDSLTFTFLDSAIVDTVLGLTPGPNRLVLFADLDADSTLSIVPDSLILHRRDPLFFTVSDSAGDTTGYSLEPWLGVEPVMIEPGLLNTMDLPNLPFVLVPATGAPVDTLSGEVANTDTIPPQPAPADSAAVTEPDHE